MLDHPHRILIRGTNWLGDAVMSTPALLRLSDRFSDAHVALLTHEKMSDLWLHHPAVNETITFAAGEGVFSIGRKLRAGKFDLALVFPNSPRSALEVWLAGIPKRIGYARPWRNAFLTDAVPTRPGHVAMYKPTVAEIKKLVAGKGDWRKSPGHHVPTSMARAHQMHEYLHLVATLGANPEPYAPRLVVAADEIQAAVKKFGLGEVVEAGRPVFALNPGAEYGPAKRWPADRYIAATREILRRTKGVCLILGGKGDVELATTIAKNATPPPLPESDTTVPAPRATYNLAGQTSLRELMALLKLSRVLLTNDSGPMHVAAALGTPVVVPFGSTSPELTGPGLPGDERQQLIRSNAPCSPCFLRKCPIDFRCMHSISVETVVESVATEFWR